MSDEFELNGKSAEEVSAWIRMNWLSGMCSRGPHRPPQGPNEDIAQCPECYSPTWSKRPRGETFGHHLPDCRLPIDHESFCEPGGSGHPPAQVIRG